RARCAHPDSRHLLPVLLRRTRAAAVGRAGLAEGGGREAMRRGKLLAAGLVLWVTAGLALAQVKTTTATETGQPMQTIQVERGEVWYVSGNDLVVKMEDGTLRNFMNVPDDVRATVDGKQLSVRELKPGMKLQRTISTTMTPAVITTVETVTGTVFSVSPPKSVVLTLEDGKNEKFDIPKGQQFDVQGKTVDAF